MARYALVDPSNVVQNMIAWDGNLTKWQPPTGWQAILVPDGVLCDIGYTFTFPSTFTFGQTPDQIATLARLAKRTNIETAVPTLRQWAQDAAGTTVTAGNTIAVLQTVVTRFGIMCDRLADLVEGDQL